MEYNDDEYKSYKINYMKKYNDIFHISLIDSYRDGGTIILYASNNIQYYINKDYTKFYYNVGDNTVIIDDEILINYLKAEIVCYREYKKEHIKWIDNIIDRICI